MPTGGRDGGLPVTMISSLKDNKMAGAITARLLTKAALGGFGRYAQWAYWHLDGLKTITGGVLAGVTGLVIWAQHHGLCDLATARWPWVHCDLWVAKLEWVTGLSAGLFLWVGQIAGALHVAPPEKPWWIRLQEIPKITPTEVAKEPQKEIVTPPPPRPPAPTPVKSEP